MCQDHRAPNSAVRPENIKDLYLWVDNKESMDNKIDRLIREGKYTNISKVITKEYNKLNMANMSAIWNIADKYHQFHFDYISKYLKAMKVIDNNMENKEYLMYFLIPFFNLMYEGIYIRSLNLLLLLLLTKNEEITKLINEAVDPNIRDNESLFILTAIENKKIRSINKLTDINESLKEKINRHERESILLFEANTLRNKFSHFEFIIEKNFNVKVNNRVYSIEEIITIIYNMYEISAIINRSVVLSCLFKSIDEGAELIRKKIKELGYDLDNITSDEFEEALKQLNK